VLTIDTKCPNEVLFVWLVDLQAILLNRGWKPDTLQIMIFVYVYSTLSTVELKTCLETWITRNDVNGVRLTHLSHLIKLMGYLCSQSTPNYQNKYLTFNWSIYRLFVLNRGWKRDSINNDICISVLHMKFSWLKTRFETWIPKNVWNGLSLFNFPYVKTLMAYVCSQRTPKVQNMYFMFDRSKYRQFVLNTV
jgi:hypothetical protein